jgi:hypothetical protein
MLTRRTIEAVTAASTRPASAVSTDAQGRYAVAVVHHATCVSNESPAHTIGVQTRGLRFEARIGRRQGISENAYRALTDLSLEMTLDAIVSRGFLREKSTPGA